MSSIKFIMVCFKLLFFKTFQACWFHQREMSGKCQPQSDKTYYSGECKCQIFMAIHPIVGEKYERSG